ncbi:MAG: hypothetical protein KGL52_16420 [Rhodospirillales bacterium]|jgi:hypothetical protein|nr:hypothetical protein [Rhodospirillales bacterium]
MAGVAERVVARTLPPIQARAAARARVGPVARLFVACAASLLLYAALFGFVLDRPLAYGFLRQQIDMKLARAAAVGSPKLVILAGSNGPYSHRCETIEPIVGEPCVNGGVAVGIGLDYLFARWERHLQSGDTVYLPMEEAQYVRSRSATDLGPDASIMFRHDWRTLARLPPDRWVAAAFSFDLRYALMAVIERALVAGGFHDPRAAAEGRTNAWGDHTSHTPALAAAYRAVLAGAHPFRATPAEIQAGYGTRLIVRFLRWCRAHGVRAIGGLPTEFRDDPMRPATRRTIRALYLRNGAGFLELPGRSLYPRADFFDTPDHLSQPWQIVQSVALGRALRGKLRGRWRRASAATVPEASSRAPHPAAR